MTKEKIINIYVWCSVSFNLKKNPRSNLNRCYKLHLNTINLFFFFLKKYKPNFCLYWLIYGFNLDKVWIYTKRKNLGKVPPMKTWVVKVKNVYNQIISFFFLKKNVPYFNKMILSITWFKWQRQFYKTRDQIKT